jgi:hypothetical protein
MMRDPDEFYIGYEPGMPTAMRRMVLIAVGSAATAALVAAVLFVSLQHTLAEARFEFGRVRSFAGYLQLSPAPVLLVPDGNDANPHWLVGPGKFGAAAAIGGAAAGWVRLDGTLIERESWRMIEVRPGSVRRQLSSAPPPPAALEPSRRSVVRGEIVDSKCFLGVMNPGERAAHRDCAVRCLSGGTPPMFAFQDASGSQLALLLGAGEHWLRNNVGRPVTLSGVLSGSRESLVFTIAER